MSIVPQNHDRQSTSTFLHSSPIINPSPTTVSRIASRWWLDPQQKSMKVRNIHTSVNLDYHATGQCVEWHQIGRESKRHVMIGISKAFVIWLLGGHVQLLWTNERIKGAYTPGMKQRCILYAGSGATESIFFTRHDLEYRFSRTTSKTCTASTACHTTADDDILD